jgi:hypothetical protein
MSARLAATQHDFQQYLFDAASDIAPQIRSGGRIPVEKRLGIYHNAYRVRLVDTLRDTYEKTWAYLGDTLFDACALAYVEAHPPAHRSLRDYGATLPKALAERFPGDPDIAELARMDGLLRQVFDGPDAVALPLEALASLSADDWETLGFAFVPTLALSPLRFNTPAIWSALDRGETPPAAAPLPAPAALCVWRRGWQPHFRSVDETEWAALERLREGARFADVCQTLHDTRVDASTLIARYLRSWLTEGLVAGITNADA